jgi:antitoxin YxxD
MFELFAKYQGPNDSPNIMYPLTIEEIEAAESTMGLAFPSELRQFYIEAGCGFWKQGAKDAARIPSAINRIAEPADIAGMICEPDYPTRPRYIEHGDIPFFDMGDRDYLLVNALSENPNQVLWQDGSLMIASVEEFFGRLYDHADYYFGGPGTF